MLPLESRSPNPRLQRTGLRLPLSRQPFGAGALIRSAWLTLACLSIAACIFPGARPGSYRKATAEDLKAISVALEDPEFWKAWGMADHPLLVGETLYRALGASADFFDFQASQNFRISEPLLASLGLVNKERRSLDGLALPRNLSMVPGFEFDRFFHGSPEEGWTRFRKRFPNVSRIAYVSRPAWSSDGHALIAIERAAAAPCCSDGYMIYLENREGSLRIAGHGGWWVT